MPNRGIDVNHINNLLGKLSAEPSLPLGVDLAKAILAQMGFDGLRETEDLLLTKLQLPNSERYDRWFKDHQYFRSDRACFEILDANDAPLQAKFYWLKKRSKQYIAGAVHFTPNYEDEEFTQNERYKVGVDFFLSPAANSLFIVLSNRGNLRVVELANKLNNTQIEILQKWQNIARLKEQSALHLTLWDSFQLKEVNKSFYTGIANLFTELLDHLKSQDKDPEASKLFASRLIGRLLFCWFLRKKNIIDESQNYFNPENAESSEYYKDKLEKLFFETLNKPIEDRIFSDNKTPFLNGGLFERHTQEQIWDKEKSLTFPPGFFVRLYQHLNDYNFTTDESTPEYQQIAIDPEMLGKIFENLLATQITESGEQARKAKGTFYTPREIVSYMCKESLRQYLYSKVGEEVKIKNAIDGLLDTTDSQWVSAGTNSKRDILKSYSSNIIKALDELTVLDPACGSGAFPMGMLHLLSQCYERLEPRFEPYKTKLSIIKNNIFGVDIEPMAIEISRLRAWLSIIVDEDSDSKKIEPLPNLDFKFVCANSLIPLENDERQIMDDPNLELKMRSLRDKYFNARTYRSKTDLRNQFNNLTKKENTLLAKSKRQLHLESYQPFNTDSVSMFFDPFFMFGLHKFNIVIANPPYGADLHKKLLTKIKKLVLDTKNMNSAAIFIDYGKNRFIENDGILSYIVPKSLLFSERWFDLVKALLGKVTILVDVEKGFEGVLLEQVLFVLRKSLSEESYTARKFLDGKFIRSIRIPNLVVSKFNAWICDVTSQEIDLACKILSNPKIEFLRNHSITKRGIGMQKLLKPSGDIPVIGGKQILPYGVNGVKGYLNYNSISKETKKYSFMMQPKIIAQNLVAHIQNPSPHLRITSTLDTTGKIFTLDTVNNIIIDEYYDARYILACLNSKLISWYAYRFIYCSAIRTMHFDEEYVNKIPIILPSSDNLRILVDLVNKTMEYLQKNKNKIIDTQLQMLSTEIDQKIYQLYDLTEEDISIITGRYN